MHRRLIFSSLLLLSALLTLCGPAGTAAAPPPGITLTVPAGRTASPGDLVTYGFTINNTTAAEVTFDISYQVTPDCQVLSDAETVTAAPGEEEIVVLSILIPSDAPAGTDIILKITLTAPGGQLGGSVGTRINPLSNLKLNGPAPAAASPGETIKLAFVLSNYGNVTETCRLEASSANGWFLTPARSSADLAPGEIRTVQFSLTIPRTTKEGDTDLVTVTVQSDSLAQPLTAKATVRAGQPVADGYARVGEDHYNLLGELGLLLGMDAAQAGLHLRLPLDDGRELELLLPVEDPFTALSLAGFFLRYRSNNLQLKMGNFSLNYGGLVYPGTGNAGLNLIYHSGIGDWRFIIGAAPSSLLDFNPAWYSLGWSDRLGKTWDLGIQLIEPLTGINTSGGPYQQASIDNRWNGHTLSLDLAYGFGAGNPWAASFYYALSSDPWFWRVAFSWEDELNRANQKGSLTLGTTYQWTKDNRLSLDLLLAGETDFSSIDPLLPSIDGYLSRGLKLTATLGRSWGLHALARAVYPEAGSWAPDELVYELGLNYAHTGIQSTFKAKAFLNATQDLLGGIGPLYYLGLSGEYDFHLPGVPGAWAAGLDAGLADYSLSNLTWNTLLFRLSYRSDGSPQNPTYLLGLDYLFNPGGDNRLALRGNLNWSITPYTKLSLEGTAAEDDFTASLKLTYQFSLGVPKPHADLTGIVFLDNNGDGRQDDSETGVSGLWVLYDGKKSVQTGPDGRWTLAGVKPGRHTIDLDVSGTNIRYLLGPIEIAVKDGKASESAFPVQRLTLLTGSAYLDLDNDGQPSEGDQPLPGLTVALTKPDGGQATAVTGEDGSFYFSDLLPGQYSIEIAPDGLPEDVESPRTAAIAIANEELLTFDLACKAKEKPVIVTYTGAPELTVVAEPAGVKPGGTFTLHVESDQTLSRLEIRIDGQDPLVYTLNDVDTWTGNLTVPADQVVGPLKLTIKGWHDGDEEPGVAEVTVEVTEPNP